MACNTCKKTQSNEKVSVNENSNFFIQIRDNTIKFLFFIVATVIIVPIVIPATIYTLFITIFTNKGINLVPLGVFIGNKLFNKDKNEEEDEDEEFDFDEDDYELEDSDKIIVVK
jgi:hypothetical protein